MSPIKTGSRLLPVRHAVNIVNKINQKINPSQISVITGDQPVYAIGTQLQWMFPTEFKDIVWMSGPHQIEQVFIKAIGDWLENNGWTNVYDYVNIN